MSQNRLANFTRLPALTQIAEGQTTQLAKPILVIYLGYMNLVDAETTQLLPECYGSELAALNLSYYLSQDYQVYFVSKHTAKYRICLKGVIYTTTAYLDERPEFWMVDILIISRYINYFLECHYQFRQLYLWIHDICLQDSYNGGRLTDVGKHLLHNNLNQINQIVVLSDWHREYFRQLYQIPDSYLTIIGNGCGSTNLADQPAKTLERVKNRFIYTSDFSRGLGRLIKYFLEIQRELPDATLAIFRDTKGYEQLVESLKTNPSIKFYGKVDNRQIIEEFRRSEFWFYPTEFLETYCISALEAQRYGCVCICSDLASLHSTVGDRGLLLPMETVQNESECVKQVVSLAKDPERKKMYQAKATSWANQQDWSQVAKRWLHLFESQLNRLKMTSRPNLARVQPTCPIICINLARRPDRKRKMINLFKQQEISQFEMMDAVDGQQLTNTPELRQMFDTSKCQFKVGEVGVTLSHLKIWERLVADPVNDYYLVMEDDFQLVEDFGRKLEQINLADHDFDFLFLGYHMWRNRLLESYDTYRYSSYDSNTQRVKIRPLNRNLYLGGLFSVIVSKRGAKKMLDSLLTTRMHSAIDMQIPRTEGFELKECQPMLVISRACDSRIDQNVTDTDIQTGINFFTQPNTFRNLEGYQFYPNLDYYGGDICHQPNLSINQLKEWTDQHPECVAFNTLGYLKRTVDTTRLYHLKDTVYQPDGLYIKRGERPSPLTGGAPAPP